MEPETGQVPFNVLSDTYNLWVPIEDDELTKSVTVDENGDFIVQGVMSSDDFDEEDDSINPEGMDCSYFLTKGWIKYEHGNNPNQFIGEPLEVRVGRFEHPTLKKAVNGVFVKGRLFANRAMAQDAVRAIQDLQKSHTKRRMGWSIEGNVKERCRSTGKVLKSILRNVVLTMNPVNTTTWAELAKSFAKAHEVEVNMVLDKSMDTEGMAELAKQSIEGQTKDPQEEWIKKFRQFVRENLLEKSLRERFISSTDGANGLNAFIFAKNNGLVEEANDFASYILERSGMLKSLFSTFGGEKMSEQAKRSLASVLDTDLEELQKSLEAYDEEDQEDTTSEEGAEGGEELTKAIGDSAENEDEGGDDSDEGGSDEGDSDEGDSDEGDSDEGDSEDEGDSDEGDSDEGDDSDEDSDDAGEGSSLRKSLAGDHPQAFEVTDFLAALTDELGFGMEGIQKSMTHMTKQQNTIVKSLTSMVQVVQDMALKVEGLESENEELRKSFEMFASQPVGRKGVASGREYQTLQKSLAGSKEGKAIPTIGQVNDILMKSFEAGELNGSEITRFEAGVPLHKLNLPAKVRSELGLA